MNRIQKLSRQIAMGALVLPPEEPVRRRPRAAQMIRVAGRAAQAGAKPFKNPAPSTPGDSTA